MASSVLSVACTFNLRSKLPVLLNFKRFKRTKAKIGPKYVRGVKGKGKAQLAIIAEGEGISLQEWLAKENVPKDPEVEARVDIGLPKPAAQQSALNIKEVLKITKSDINIAREARQRTLKISMQEERKDWKMTVGPEQIQIIADHYGIYSDLFRHGYFTPYVVMDILYDYDDKYVTPVHRGNVISASETRKVPKIYFDSNPDDMWTLILTNLDGHLLINDAEYLHWFVGNIKGNDIRTGEVICDYLKPFAYRGTGYHRFAFILYKQDQPIDFSSLKKKSPCVCLKERTFSTFDFYKEHQDYITPAGLSFFQSKWDDCLTEFFHQTLQMNEPIFQYNMPEVYVPKQVHYPIREPFNLYLDRYRPKKEIVREVVLKRLKSLSPFEEELPEPKYPLIYTLPRSMPSWQKMQVGYEKRRLGRYKHLNKYTAETALQTEIEEVDI